jgi:uncharacterized protein (TIGR04255 family)
MFEVSELNDSVDSIVHFSAPPIVEVVASVRLAGSLTDAAMMSVGTLWRNQLREDLPGFSLVGPYEMPDDPQPGQPSAQEVQFRVGMPPLPRVWLTSPGQTELVQIQHNYFAVNWRKVSPDDEYDHWGKRRTAFKKRWEAFRGWAESLDEVVEPQRFEITYINHITPIEGLWAGFGDADAVFEGIDVPAPDGAPLDQFSISSVYSMGEGAARTVVSVNAQPGFYGNEASAGILLNITARGSIDRPDDVVGALGRGREAVVKTFLRVTSPAAKEAWGEER